MKLKQPTLNNFALFKFLELFENSVRLSQSGIIHSKRQVCNNCGCFCNYNGSSNKGKHSLSKSINSLFRKGQQICPNCGKTIQTNNEWRDDTMENINQFLKSQIISLSEDMSENGIINHLERTMSIRISKSTVHNVIKNVNKKLRDYNFEYDIQEEFYAYDEQYISINGRRAYRLVIFDLKNKIQIYEKIYEKFSKKILKQVLREVFGDTRPKGFVVDMRVEYPSAFEAVFGKKINVQFCVFHLNKLILKEYNDCMKVGKKSKWDLINYYYLYSLFNIFYNREYEINIVKNMFENWTDFKKKINTEIINKYKKKYNLTIKDEQKLKLKIQEIEQRRLIKKFRKILHDKRNERKRNKQTLPVRSVESAAKVFENVNKTRSKYPEIIRKRIIKIKEKFNYFTASKGEVLTTNKLEGFFGTTLRKFRKKSSRCFLSLTSLLKRKRARQQGVEFFKRFTITEIAAVFMSVAFFT